MEREYQQEAQERLEMLDAVAAAFARRTEVLEAAFDAATPQDAILSVRELLNVAERHARAVVDLQFRRLTAEARHRIDEERESIRAALT